MNYTPKIDVTTKASAATIIVTQILIPLSQALYANLQDYIKNIIANYQWYRLKNILIVYLNL